MIQDTKTNAEDLRQSSAWGKYLETLGWRTEIIDGCALRIRRIGPLGSVIKIQRPRTLPLEKIEEVAKKNRALFVKIEPSDNIQIPELKPRNFQPDSWPLTPPRTVIIDLMRDDEELLKSFSKDTRQSIKSVFNSGLTIQHYSFENPNDENEKALREFYSLWKETGKRGRFYISAYQELSNKMAAFGKNAILILAIGKDSRALSGCIAIIHDSISYYHHAASARAGQQILAPYAVLWRLIKENKKRECKKLDLEGIFDLRYPNMGKRWINFSIFKLKWGGEVLEYPGSFIKFYNPLVKLLFRFGN